MKKQKKNRNAKALGALGGRACWQGVPSAEISARMSAIAKLPRKSRRKNNV
jgi:hypothetical protein